MILRLVVALTLSLSAFAANAAPAFKVAEALIKEQKHQAALRVIDQIIASKPAGDDATKAYVLRARIQLALNRIEEAVNSWRQVPRADDPVANALLALHGAQIWQRYLVVYGYEIDQRELTSGAVATDKLTRQQIADAILAAYAVAWNERAALGKSIAVWDEYLESNNYPAGIRDTQRDALTYFLAAFLADSANWTPGEQNRVYELPLAKLGADADDVPQVKITDDTKHPIERSAAVLADLEEWAGDQDRDGGALNAHAMRMQTLKEAFSNEKSQAWLVDAYSDYLSGEKSNPWWPAGMAILAQWHQSAGDWRAARDVALAGRDKDPGSVGGQQCNFVLIGLERPQFEIEAMAVDGPERDSVRIEHRNVNKLYWRAYPLSLEAALNRQRLATTVRSNLKESAQQEWQTELKDLGDLKEHRTFMQPPLSKKGFYLLVASSDKSFKEPVSRLQAVVFNISGLTIIKHTENGSKLVVTVVDATHGTPVAGASVSFYRVDGARPPAAVKTSDARGQVSLVATDYAQFYLVAKYGDNVTVDAGYNYVYPSRGDEQRVTSSFVYTDRSVYRPGQTIQFKVIAYAGSGRKADFRTRAETTVNVKLLDSGGQTVLTEALKTNKFGSASGSFKIPNGRPLGRWYIAAAGGGADVSVEEYKRPTYEVKIAAPMAALRLNRDATFTGEARYFFGQPVTAGQVVWRVSRERRFPWWWNYWGGVSNSTAESIANDRVKIAADGSFKVTFKPEADEDEAASGVSYRYTLAVDVTDEGGETRSIERSFAIGFVAVEAKILASAGFFTASNATFSVARTDLGGAPRAGAGSWRIVALKQPKAAKMPSELPAGRRPSFLPLPKQKSTAERLPGDDQVPRWETNYDQTVQMGFWDDGEQIADGATQHGKDGEATIKALELKPGAYRLRYETKDEFGAVQKTWKDFIVANKDQGLSLALPAYMAVSKGSVKAGDPIHVLVHTGLPKQTTLLDIFSDGVLKERRVLRGSSSGVIEIPTTGAMRGGLGLKLTVVHDHQLITVNDSVMIPWDDRDIALSFSRFRDRIVPGSKETWRVKLAGAKPADGIELLAYMYDRSLDLFAPHNPPDSRGLLPVRTHVSSTSSSVIAEHGRSPWTVDLPRVDPPRLEGDELRYLGGGRRGSYGIGSGGIRTQFSMLQESAALTDDLKAAAPPMAAAPKAASNLASSVTLKKRELGAEKNLHGPSATTVAPTPVRQNFSETAFFKPHLLIDNKGEVALEFDVPDAVTAWTVWVHAMKRDLSAGSLTRETRTVKDLLVRPYLTRFLREGDATTWRVMVNNDSGKALKGQVEIAISDPDSGDDLTSRFGIKDKAQAFDVASGQSATVSFKLAVPDRVKPIAVTIKGVAGDLSDGERHLVPVLPSRIRVSESKFAYLDKVGSRTLSFTAPAGDQTFATEQLVATVDGQLFYGALNALPYLIDYPFECIEQTLNRFVSTGILASLFKRYPAVAAVSQQMQQRQTRWEPWDAGDPNRRMQLEETPWLFQAKGGDTERLIKVLDPRLVAAERQAAIGKLQKARNADGGLPWFAGGRSSPYMTLYVLLGLAKAAEFGVTPPADLIGGAWRYLAGHYRGEWRDELNKPQSKGCCVESLVLLNYVATALPASPSLEGVLPKKDREAILAYTYEHRQQLSRYLKSFLALTLKRMDRGPDAVKVMAAVMDAARTDKDLGTYWAPEDRAWLWYNDSIESHSWALRALQEISPQDAKLPGLVQWLFVNKKLSHWKSTRATAEAIYALAHYMKKEALMTTAETLTVKAEGQSTVFSYAPNKFVGKNQWRLGPTDLPAGKAPTVTFEKATQAPMMASATWHYATTTAPAEDRGDLLAVARQYFKRSLVSGETRLEPLKPGDAVAVGDEVEVQLTVRAKHAAEYVHLNDPRPAGFEPLTLTSGHRYDLGVSRYEEVRDSGINMFFEWLPVGEYLMKHRLRAANAGLFQVAPATLQSLYAPEFTAYTAGSELNVGD